MLWHLAMVLPKMSVWRLLPAQDYRTLKLDYEAYQKNCAVLVTEEKEGEQVKEIVSVGAPVKDLNLVIANPKTKKPYPDLHIGEIFISGDSVANGYWGNLKENANFRVRLEGYDRNFYKTGDLGFCTKVISTSPVVSRKC